MFSENSTYNLSQQVSRTGENIVNIFRVTPQWEIPAIFFGTLGTIAASILLEYVSNGRILESVISTGALLGCIGDTYFCESQSYSYIQDYEKMKKMFISHGWDQRTVEQKVYFYCGRRAAMFAAIDTGYQNEFNGYLSEHLKRRQRKLDLA